MFSINHFSNTWLWHNRLGHATMNVVNKLSRHDLVKGLLKLKYERDHVTTPLPESPQPRESRGIVKKNRYKIKFN